jgi:hypothetical protein
MPKSCPVKAEKNLTAENHGETVNTQQFRAKFTLYLLKIDFRELPGVANEQEHR